MNPDHEFWGTIVRALVMVTRAVLVHKLGRNPDEVFVNKR